MSVTLLDAEVDRLTAKMAAYGPGGAWKQNEFSEILPFPKPLSLSVLRLLASHDGATGKVCRELGLPCNPDVPAEDYLETVFGRLFVNSSAERMLTGAGRPQPFLQKLACATRIRQEITSFYRRFGETVAALDAHYQQHRETDLAALTERELLARIERLVEALDDHYQHVVKAGLFAKFKLDELGARCGEENLARLLVTDSPPPNRDPAAREIFAFREKTLAAFCGYGADIEYELACPRFLENNLPPIQTPAKAKALPMGTAADRKIRVPLLFFKVYESLKVIFKTLLLRELYLLRLTLVEYDRRHGGEGKVFYLKLEELLAGEVAALAERIAQRQAAEAVFGQIDLPTAVFPSELPDLVRGYAKNRRHPLKGISINGLAFEGRALIYRRKTDLEHADATRIVVAKQANPNLIMAFSHARGIITETGGLLSHLAIVAREQGFSLVLQVEDATALIKEGDRVSVSEDGSISVTP